MVVKLTSDARDVLDGYLAEQKMKSRTRFWTTVGTVVVANLAMLGTMYASVRATAKDAAVAKALEYVTSEASDVRSSFDSLDEILKQQLAAVMDSIGSAREAMGSLTNEHESLASRLSALEKSASDAEQIQASVNLQLTSLDEGISKDRMRAEQRQAELYKDIEGNLARERARLAALAAEIELLQHAVTGLAGEDGRERLSRFRILAEELSTGEPADVLLGALARISKLEAMVAHGFNTLRCRELVVQSETGERLVELVSEEHGGAIQLYRRGETIPRIALYADRRVPSNTQTGGYDIRPESDPLFEGTVVSGVFIGSLPGPALSLGTVNNMPVFSMLDKFDSRLSIKGYGKNFGFQMYSQQSQTTTNMTFPTNQCRVGFGGAGSCGGTIDFLLDSGKPQIRFFDEEGKFKKVLK